MEKNIMLFLSLILLSLLFTDCNKDTNIPDEKQYLFDGLPYYLTDTLFNERTYPDTLHAGIRNIEFDSKGFAWLLDGFDQLYRYDPASKELIWWSREDIVGNDFPIYMKNLFVDSRDRVWGNTLGKLYLFEGTTVKTIQFPTSVWGGEMAEDKEGIIHFHGSDSKEHVCDGEIVTDVDPVFAPDDYLIHTIFNDNQGNLWYVMNQTIVNSYYKDIVKYSGGDDYMLMPELPNKPSGGHMCSDNLAFDSNNNAYLATHNIVYRTGVNNNWDTVCSWGIFDDISCNELYIDHGDNLWFTLLPNTEVSDPNIIAIVKDGECITESSYNKIISKMFMIDDICFPDENTVWVCSGTVYEFKK